MNQKEILNITVLNILTKASAKAFSASLLCCKILWVKGRADEGGLSNEDICERPRRNLDNDPILVGLVSLEVSLELVELLGPGMPEIPPPDNFLGRAVGDW